MKGLNAFLRTSKQWDKKYLAAVTYAINKYEGVQKAQTTIKKYLNEQNQGQFSLVNSRQLFRRELLTAVADLENDVFRPGQVAMLATFVEQAWACCDRAINFDFAIAKQKIRNAMAGMNYIGVFEPGVYPDEKRVVDGKAGSLVSVHCHAIVFATSVSKLRRHKSKIESRFEAVDGEGTTFPVLNNLRTMLDLKTALRYFTKMPFKGYKKQKCADGTKQEYADLRPVNHYCLFSFLKAHSLFDAWFAGGESTRLLREARLARMRTAAK
jgi:hypothetical protein